jgi:hypothetical protein
MLADAGVRMRPLNRADPEQGHWIGDCPRCGKPDALFVEPGGLAFSTICGCESGGLVALFRLLLVRS